MKLIWAAALLFASAGLTKVDEASWPKLVPAHRGKVVLVDFWATWCDPCRAELPILIKLEKQWRDRGFVLVTVSADEPEKIADARAFLDKVGFRGPAYRKSAENDEKFINLVNPKWSGALPALFLFDRSGRMVRFFEGETEEKDLVSAVTSLLR